MRTAHVADNRGRRLVTVDTGGPDDVYPGCLVTWLHVPRGGYGFITPIPAKVIAHGRQSHTYVTIEVVTVAGRKVTRRVEAKNLRWSQPAIAEHVAPEAK